MTELLDMCLSNQTAVMTPTDRDRVSIVSTQASYSA
jgi:hypothetical protein